MIFQHITKEKNLQSILINGLQINSKQSGFCKKFYHKFYKQKYGLQPIFLTLDYKWICVNQLTKQWIDKHKLYLIEVDVEFEKIIPIDLKQLKEFIIKENIPVGKNNINKENIMVETIYENQSLRFIINAINVGLIQYEKPEQLLISSETLKDIFIKMSEIDMTGFIKELIGSEFNLQKTITDVEVNAYDFFVFTIVINTDDDGNETRTLMCNSLLELITINENVENQVWSIDNRIWKLSITK